MTAAPLPPLPPVPGVNGGELRPGGPSMIDLLTEDHVRMEQLCDRLAAGDEDGRRVEEVLVAMLSRHLSSEEQYLYPTVRKVLTDDGGPVADAEVSADAEMLRALQDLHVTARDDAGYPAKVSAVTDVIRAHTARLDDSLFPRLLADCTDVELIRLGNRIQIAQEAAPTRPHTGTPSTPPLNKVVEPAIGVVDKVRDVLTGRTTWPQDLS